MYTNSGSGGCKRRVISWWTRNRSLKFPLWLRSFGVNQRWAAKTTSRTEQGRFFSNKRLLRPSFSHVLPPSLFLFCFPSVAIHDRPRRIDGRPNAARARRTDDCCWWTGRLELRHR